MTERKVELTEVMDENVQEIGCSRKVAIGWAGKQDMLVCRHSWQCAVVEGCGEAALTTGVRCSAAGV